MIIKQYVKDFENLGLGMFVHFGLYSVLGQGEWALESLKISEEIYASLFEQFHPKEDWAVNLVNAAKQAGCKYITLTARHHEGFSLYDTCGLSDYDSVHCCGRDLVQEFIDACRTEDIIPMFYHCLLDWHEKTYYTDFKGYLRYLRDSVEILCSKYGKIGGIWFDGIWDQPEADWEEDLLYATIRKHQPEAMIINNTGLSARGTLGHIELDSVTFERGNPKPINMEGAPKYVASEMCEIMGEHWGYAKDDLHYKAPADLIREFVDCRRHGANMLLNVGPKGDGSLRLIDAGVLELFGQWTGYFDEAIRKPRPCGIEVKGGEDNFLLQDGDNYYLFCLGLPMITDHNVALFKDHDYRCMFDLDKKIISVEWMDNGDDVPFEQESGKVIIHMVPFDYGRDLVVRVALIKADAR